MGLIKAATGAAGGVLGDQWKDYFYCDAMSGDTLALKAGKRSSRRSSNRKGAENIISDGSVIAVSDGQCMLIVEQGKVVDVCAQPGEYVYDASSEPSLFCGNLEEGILSIFQQIGKRFTFGGEAPKDQRVYYINTRELTGNKYGTPGPVPFRVTDVNMGLDMDISVRCFGEYSYRIANPLLFYTNVCGNVEEEFTREALDAQLRSELMTALQPAFAKISAQGIRYSELPGHTMELSDALNQILSEKWESLRGIRMVSLGISSIKASEEDEAMLKELQRNAVFRNPSMAAAHMVGAQASAMQAAASNQNAGAAMAFAGMNMAANTGGLNPTELFAMAERNQAQGIMQPDAAPRQTAAAGESWTCACGTVNQGKFCSECGSPRPRKSWVCSCGTVNEGKFCSECGRPKA